MKLRFLSPAMALQTTAHLIYILIFFLIYAQKRPLWLPVAMVLFALVIESILSRLFLKDWCLTISLGSIAIANSIFLNMEAYGILYWPFFVAIAIAILAKNLLRVNQKPIFNPSLIGIFFIACLLPNYGSTAMYFWRPLWSFIFIVFILGTVTSLYAGTIRLSYSYLVSFIFWGFFGLKFVLLFPDLGRLTQMAHETPQLLWPLAIFNFGNILFAFHGIGDPVTAPRSARGQILFGLALGTFDFFGRIFDLLNSNFIGYAVCLLVYAFWKCRTGISQEELLRRVQVGEAC